MGREYGTESRAREGKVTVQPTFVLVGAPGIGKRDIADKLARDYFTEKLGVQNETFPVGAALGMMADYRVELKLASDRAVRLASVERATLYTHSLIDNLAYSLIHADINSELATPNHQPGSEWWLTMAVVGNMLRDTFKADEVLFLVAAFDPDTHYDQARMQETMEFILEGFGYPYTVIDVDTEEAVDDIARVIEGHLE